MIDPERCTTMAEVRAGIDQLDQEIVNLLARRFQFIEAAARVKQSRGEVRDERRKAEVIERVRAHARNAAIPDDLIGRFYDDLIESSIAIELARFDTKK
jgi:isochorismate pyruvate lyase